VWLTTAADDQSSCHCVAVNIIIIIIINEFHRDASLTKTSGPLGTDWYELMNLTFIGFWQGAGLVADKHSYNKK